MKSWVLAELSWGLLNGINQLTTESIQYAVSIPGRWHRKKYDPLLLHPSLASPCVAATCLGFLPTPPPPRSI